MCIVLTILIHAYGIYNLLKLRIPQSCTKHPVSGTLCRDSILVAHLLLRVGREPLVQAGLRDSRGHAVGHQVRRHGTYGVLSSWCCSQETRGGRLRCQDSWGGDLLDLGLRDGAVAGADLGGKDLLEAGFEGNLLNTLEVLDIDVRILLL